MYNRRSQPHNRFECKKCGVGFWRPNLNWELCNSCYHKKLIEDLPDMEEILVEKNKVEKEHEKVLKDLLLCSDPNQGPDDKKRADDHDREIPSRLLASANPFALLNNFAPIGIPQSFPLHDVFFH